jgi:D-sedoheptulose 7-phosphate isomerase
LYNKSSIDGGKLKQMADITIHVPTGKDYYSPAESAHMMLDYLVSSYLIDFVKNQVK